MKKNDVLKEYAIRHLLEMGLVFHQQRRVEDWCKILEVNLSAHREYLEEYATHKKGSKNTRSNAKVLRKGKRRRSAIRKH